MASREGRHTAKISTWLLRFGFFSKREDAVKAIKRGRVFFQGRRTNTMFSVTRPKPEDFEVK